MTAKRLNIEYLNQLHNIAKMGVPVGLVSPAKLIYIECAIEAHRIMDTERVSLYVATERIAQALQRDADTLQKGIRQL